MVPTGTIVEAVRSETLAEIATATRDVADLGRLLQRATEIVGRRSRALTAAVFLPEGEDGALVLRHPWLSKAGLLPFDGVPWFPKGTHPYRVLVGERRALVAPNREAVRGFHAAALAVGGRDNGTPGPRPYHPGYYSAFVLDPDGNNIEAVVDWAGWFENHR